ncbi:MAG: hypothetical protein JWN44_4293 [Myxococcales bacterium]|nr:hypothetical protein [Myxococcales bacterium]
MRLILVTVAVITAAAGCDKPLDTTRVVEPYGTFGEIIYREGCQRVAYTGQLAQKAAGTIQTVDVSGSLGRSVCVENAAPPSDAPIKLSTIVQQKAELVTTVDNVAPKDFLDTLENFLEQLRPLADDGTMEHAIASLGDLLGTMAADPDFSPALARLATRVGYRPTKTAAGLVRTIVNYPNIDDFLGKTLGLIAPGGTAETEWKQLLTAGSMALKNVQPVANPADSERTLKLALNLMTSTHPDLATGAARPLVARDYRGLATAQTLNGKVQAPFVDKDNDGLADVDNMGHFVDASGNVLAVPSPFPELGPADTAPRDAQGRALTAQGGTTTVYKYFDLDGTVFGGLAREGLKLMDPQKDTTLGLVWGASALLGPRKSQTQIYMDSAGGMIGSLNYNGFDTTQSAVLDLVHGFVQLFGDPSADSTFQATATLLNQYESPTARLIGAMLDAVDRGKKHPEAQVPETSVLYDELMPLVNRILAVPGLADDLMNALEDNRTKDLAPMIARLMAARNQIDFVRTGPAYPLKMNGQDLDAVDPVDRTKPDDDFNRSLMQRIAHLIHDANGVRFCNKAGASALGATFPNECDMFQIDDLALFYILNMQTDASTASNPSAKAGADFCGHLVTNNVLINTGCTTGLIEGPLGANLNGFKQFPTPAGLNRALFLKRGVDGNSFLDNTTNDQPCADGDKFIDAHDKSLFAWEARMVNAPSGNANATFYTAIAPLVDAFAKHDECVARNPQNMQCTKTQNAAKILVDLFAMLHTHWASPTSTYAGHKYQSTMPSAPRFSYPDSVVSYEPLMIEVLGQGDLMPALLALAPTLNTMTVDGKAGSPLARPSILATARYLLQPGVAKGIAYRSGATSTVRSDGTTAVPVTTPYYMIADAYAAKRAALAQAGMPQGAAWKTSTSALVDQLLTVQKNANGTYQFANRRFRGISILMVNFLRGRIAAHAKAGDLDTWVHQTLTQDMTDTLGGPTFAALADFTAKVENDTDARTQLYGLLQYLVNEADNDLAFQTALTTMADQVQMFLDDPDLVPVARVMGAALDPQKGTVDAQLTLMNKAHGLDTKKALLTILRNLYKQDTNGIYPASNLADVLSELNRATPGQGGALSGADYKSILGEVQNFLIDDQRGFLRFLNIVKARGPH